MPTNKNVTKAASGKRLVERSPSQIKFILIALALVLVAFCGAYFLGTNSSGQINVAATIQEGDRQNPEREKVNPNVRATVPNGGLVPTNLPTTQNNPPAITEENATSTDDMATSTDETIDEETNEVATAEDVEAEVAEETPSTESAPDEESGSSEDAA